MDVICEHCKQSFASELDYVLPRDMTGHKKFGTRDYMRTERGK